MKLYNNKDAPKRGDTNYNPDYKFGFIYMYIVHNINAITQWVDLDQSGDDVFGEKEVAQQAASEENMA